MIPCRTEFRPATSRLEALLAQGGGAVTNAARKEACAIGLDEAGSIAAAILDAELAAPGDSETPMAAARLAAELRVADVVPSLLRCVEHLEPDDPLWDETLLALEHIGPATLDPALAAFSRCDDPLRQGQLAEVLVRLGVRDDRIFDALVAVLGRDDDLGAGLLAAYGDPRALPALSVALDEAQVDDDEGLLANQHIVELKAAIEELGGTFAPSQEQKIARVMKPRERFRRLFQEATQLAARKIAFPSVPARQLARPGRNEPCHCGSGKKYKKCHLPAEGA